jgi:hydroxymethylpyrimidine pyrophosphatase-like HAD family hydrolase
MRYLVLVSDYDGTVATEGRAETAALKAIERLRTSGRRVILLTGRRIDDLLAACPRLRLFDYVVAENGAVIYDPRTHEQTLLGRPPPARFVKRLKELTDNSLEVGKSCGQHLTVSSSRAARDDPADGLGTAAYL